MDFEPMCEAYSSRSEQYIGLIDDDWQTDDDAEKDLVRRHLTGLAGPVLDVGCGPDPATGPRTCISAALM
ncbi:hypothetical protein [Leekyejoonella antrihumi]|uniref:hypothetical protein n=1 Tax=Leekyejoonella antrihumi TaxID=1660198 RepID=UPI001FEAF61B|nr:hypothetical protein [Leekyejoonella antrihumi]